MNTKERGLMIGAIAVLLFSLAIDLRLTTKYGGVDLRDKIVGARSLMEGRSLYFDPWRPGEPERFADPMVPPGADMTRYTGTPFQALVMAPLGVLPFGALRIPWLLAQYALLLLSLLMAYRSFAPRDARSHLVVAGLLLLFLASSSWHLHVERGQVYVIFAAVIAGLFAAFAQGRMLLAGVLAAVLVLFKPTYAVLLLPLLPRVSWRMLGGGAGTVVAVALIFALLPNGSRSWVEYREAMSVWSGLIGQGEPPSMDPDAFVYPETIEGRTNLRDHHPMEFENGSVTAILHGLGVDVPGWMPWAAFGLFLVAIFILLGRSILRARHTELLLLGFCCWTTLMILLPVPRFDYQLVHWVGPLAFVLLTSRERPFAWNAALVLASALIIGAWSLLPVNILMAELILLVLMLQLLRERMRPAMPVV